MKKRITSLLLLLSICFTLIFSPTYQTAQAAENQPATKIDPWAITDWSYGITYGIYPDSWNNTDLTKNISLSKLYILISGVRLKILETELATEKNNIKLSLDNTITVEDVLNAFYTILASYSYTTDLGINNKLKPIEYMKKHGIYTGKNGEQALTDRCTIEQSIVIATRIITYVYDTLGAASKGFFWEVKAGDNTVYMLGSVHAASYSIYPFNQKLLKAFHDSDALIVEANTFDTADSNAYQQMAFYSDGTSLKDHITAETYKKVVDTAAFLGLPEAAVNQLKPWYLETLFEYSAVAGNSLDEQINTGLGIDLILLSYAMVNQKKIYAIESLLNHAMILDSFSEELHEYLLNTYIDSYNEVTNGLASSDAINSNDYIGLMLQYWHEGNYEAFYEAVKAEDKAVDDLGIEQPALTKEFEDKLFTQRDNKMADYIDNLLKTEGSNTYFVVVGSAHYISEYSVIDRLKEKGYKVDFIK